MLSASCRPFRTTHDKVMLCVIRKFNDFLNTCPFVCREKPHDVEWLELAKHKVPLLLNYAQCRLLAQDYYSVIEHCTEVLQLDPDNVKALFRRAKAHYGAWNPQEAREDFQRAAELDPTLQSAVNKELKAIDKTQHERDIEDKKRLQSLF